MESSKTIALLILAVFSVIVGATSNDCPTKYARFSSQHSFCLPRNSTCSILKEGIDKSARKVILRVHNKLRSKVANGKESRAGGLSTASNMLQMVWDEELASIAQKWVAQCLFEHDCGDCRAVEDFKVGQNLAFEDVPCSSNDCINEAGKPDWKSMIKMFYDEVSLFNNQAISPFQSLSGVLHFTQVAWANSWKIGCGYAVFKNGIYVRKLYGCNYGPAGNTVGDSMYKSGKPCSACPSNTCCGTCKIKGPTYNGLCRVLNLSLGPVYDNKKDALVDCNWRDEKSPCKVKESGKKNWKLKRSLGGPYRTITLKGGQKSTLKLIAPIKPKKSEFCLVVHFRKGPVNAANQDSSSLKLLLNIPEWNSSPSMDLQTSTKSFVSYPIDLGWNAKTKVTLEFSVPATASEHILDVKEIIAYDGKCSKS